MFREYYTKLFDKYYGSTVKKKKNFWFDLSVCIFWLAPGFDLIFVLPFLAQHVQSAEIDSGISQAIRNSNKIS